MSPQDDNRPGGRPRRAGWRYRLRPVSLAWERPDPAYVTWSVVGLCVLVFLYQMSLPVPEMIDFVRRWGMTPAHFFNRLPGDLEPLGLATVLTPITHMFVHGGLLHLFVNMIAFESFGRPIEFLLGHGRFLAFFLLCGIVAAFTHALFLPESSVPMVGASGAIFGVVSCYLLFHPKNPVIFLLLPIPVPLWILLSIFMVLHVIFIVFDIWGGVAWLAHIGGFVAGLVLFPFFAKRDRVRQYKAMVRGR